MSQTPIDKVLQDYIDYLALELPDRVFTRIWKPRDAFNNNDLAPGHFTMVYKAYRSAQDPDFIEIDLLLVGRIYCGIDADGLAVEQAELEMEHDIRDFCSGTNGAALRIDSAACSHQLETPHGWVVLDCKSGPHSVRTSSLWEDENLFPGISELTVNGEVIDDPA